MGSIGDGEGEGRSDAPGIETSFIPFIPPVFHHTTEQNTHTHTHNSTLLGRGTDGRRFGATNRKQRTRSSETRGQATISHSGPTGLPPLWYEGETKRRQFRDHRPDGNTGGGGRGSPIVIHRETYRTTNLVL